MSELDLLRRCYPEPSPASAPARAQARAVLLERFDESRPSWRRRLQGIAPAPLVATALVALVLGALALQLAGDDDPAPNAGAQALLDAAETAREQPPVAIPRGSFLYSRIVEGRVTRERGGVSLLRTTVAEEWIGANGRSRSRTTRRKPRFLRPADRGRWIASGRPLPAPAGGSSRISPARSARTPDLPTSATQVLDRLRVGEGRPDPAQATFTRIADELADPLIAPLQRAALYEAAAQVPGVDLVRSPKRDEVIREGVAVGVSGHPYDVRDMLAFDPETATLLSTERVALPEEGEPDSAERRLAFATYSTAIVDEVGDVDGRSPFTEAKPAPASPQEPAEPASPIASQERRVLTGGELRGKEVVQTFEKSFQGIVEEGIGELSFIADRRWAIEEAQKFAGLTRMCDLMTDGLREQTLAYGELWAARADVDWTCPKALSVLVHFLRTEGKLSAAADWTVVGVHVVEGGAVAEVSMGDGKTSEVALVEVDGQWRIGSLPYFEVHPKDL